MANLAYRLGLPAWNFPGWKDRYFTANPSALASYSSVFNAVEGNTTFYGIPSAKTVNDWRVALRGNDFQFSFKLPRTITHEHTPAIDELHKFMRAIEPLEEHIGPIFLQFPSRVGPAQLDELDTLCRALPSRYRYVIEVRHRSFHTQPHLLQPLLDEFGFGRVVFDTRAVFEGDSQHREVLSARHEKPDLPVLTQTYNNLAFIRLLLHPDRASNTPYIDEWAERIARYLAEGVEPYLFIHCPNNQHCPDMADEFHQVLMSQPTVRPLAPLTPWPVPQQTSLL